MTTHEAAPMPAAAADPAMDRWSALSDRLNPILVREVQQAVKGRVFVLTVFGALLASVVIAISVASDYRSGTGGRGAFDAGLAVLVPLLLFVVPMQAYQSMRLELRSGIVEQLLLSRLRPWRIILGKLAAAMVQFVLYVSVLAPLLATSYLLRGVDLPTIGMSLGFALVFCIAATSFAISSAAQGVLPALQPIANIGVAFGLGMASFGLTAFVGSGEYVRDLGWLMSSREFGTVTSVVFIGSFVGSVMSGLIAQSFLLHAFENRSTAFRVFLLAMAPLAFGWMFTFVDRVHWDEALPVVTFFLVLLGAGFGIFMVTEQQQLSPRGRAHVPANAALALLAAPLLPGRDRGMACLLSYYALVAAVAVSFWPSGTHFFRDGLAGMSLFAGTYALVYLTLGKALRGKLPAAVAGNHLARFAIPLLLLLFCIAPVLLDVFVQGGVRQWHYGHAMNPFWTIERFAARQVPAAVRNGLVAAGLVVVLQVPSLVRAWREVMAASAARRQQAAEGAELRGAP